MTVRFGRLAGIEVGANWSVLVILILVAESLAAGLLPAAVPGRSALTYWVTATTVAVLFLGCLLAHELAHAIVARRAGVRVEGITLWMLGGVTRLSGEPATARADLAVAAAGPATSIAIGALLLGAAVGLSAIGVPATTEPSVALAGLAWLGWINLVLAVFNLLPGAPLDGGRILRALLWWRGGDRIRAAVAATRAGAVVGAALIALGVADALAGGAVGGLWLALIGWFLVAAAGQERRDTLLRSALAGVMVGEVMTPEPDCAPSWLTVDAFAAGLAPARQHRSYPLLDIDRRLVAVVTLRQLGGVPPGDRATIRLIDVATPLARVPTAQPREPLVEVLARRAITDPELPILVLDGARLVGILTHTDVTRARLQATPQPHAPREASGPPPLGQDQAVAPNGMSAAGRPSDLGGTDGPVGCQDALPVARGQRMRRWEGSDDGRRSDYGRRTWRFSLPHPADKC